jgi:hypothetical protein
MARKATRNLRCRGKTIRLFGHNDVATGLRGSQSVGAIIAKDAQKRSK